MRRRMNGQTNGRSEAPRQTLATHNPVYCFAKTGMQ